MIITGQKVISIKKCEEIGKALKNIGVDIKTEWENLDNGYCNFYFNNIDNLGLYIFRTTIDNVYFEDCIVENTEFEGSRLEGLHINRTEVNKMGITPE